MLMEQIRRFLFPINVFTGIMAKENMRKPAADFYSRKMTEIVSPADCLGWGSSCLVFVSASISVFWEKDVSCRFRIRINQSMPSPY